jgi:hypothetical protein
LLLANIDVNVDLYDESLMREIQEILANFDPNADNIEDELTFTARFMRSDRRFGRKQRRGSGEKNYRKGRANVVKVADTKTKRLE